MDLTRREAATILAGTVAAGAASKVSATPRPAYRDLSLQAVRRADDLIARMSLDEKVLQLIGIADGKSRIQDAAGAFDPAAASHAFPQGFGHICSPSFSNIGTAGVTPGRTARECAAYMNALQGWALKQTRLGIPVLGHEESLHGLRARDATSFPQAIGLASSWDPELVERVFTLAAAETRARGSHMVLTPVLDVTREPRWGRVEETYGEDPHLVAAIGLAAVRGFQGRSLPVAPDRVLATVKHFAGHGVPEGGTNTAPLMIGERTLRDALLPPYRSAVRDGHALSVMGTYHEIDGVPMMANHWLLNDVLRQEWGFEGMVISDYKAITELATIHGVAQDAADAARIAIMAGVDVELPDPEAFLHLPVLVRAGKVPLSRIDEAVRRVLAVKIESGLFDAPYVEEAKADVRTGDTAGRSLAREAANRCMVLLKNEADLLPLDKARVGRLAVLGISAEDTPIGGYSDVPRRVVSVVEALRAEAEPGFQVDHAVGVRLTRSRNWYEDAVVPPTPEEAETLRNEAVALARRSDTILLVLGDNEQTAREAWSKEHMGDRTSLDLFGAQEQLAEAVLALGKPTIVLLLNGRPLAIERIAKQAPAILEGWYLGQETGSAVADVLFGRTNPGGKLPLTIPRSVGQLPVYYAAKPSARRGYLLDTTAPLFPFGHGLSYTRFELSAPRLSRTTIAAGESVRVLVDVQNIGGRAGDEVVQVYVRDVVASVTQPVRALKAFRRVSLQPGERRTVELALEADAFALWNLQMQRVVEPGEFRIEAGPGLDRLQAVTLTVTA